MPDEEAVEIRELLRLTGSEDMARQVMRRMLDMQKQGRNEREQALIERFAAKLDVSELQDAIVRVYAEHFTADEVRGINAFFRSPAGRKYVAEMPAMLQDAMSIGQAWAAAKAKALDEELQREMSKPTSL
ncbi:DUF2059 domain-containing protein [Lysobacter humi (ex Lee et al. 2017)]